MLRVTEYPPAHLVHALRVEAMSTSPQEAWTPLHIQEHTEAASGWKEQQ
jgi:hypothetical protein